ncbi:MAG: hypothetical protein WC046_08460 [Candidatus Bathyarchaeia archaeon]
MAEKKRKLEFRESSVSSLDLSKDENFALLIIEYLCGKKLEKSDLDARAKLMLTKFQENIQNEMLNFEQFNELLLVLNQDRISKGFFEYFFPEKINYEKLKEGIIRFRGHAMLYFGNFRFAFKELSKKSVDDIDRVFTPLCKEQPSSRPKKVLDIQKIEKTKTWYLGYISGAKVNKEADALDCLGEENEIYKKSQSDFKPKLQKMTLDIESTREIGYSNTDIYLTWDYIDVYVATSMRNKWEFEDIYEFIDSLENDKVVSCSRLRFFDPTQSFCSNPKDKGLIEGLMLRRALITIYMAQESDTMGKDSELAATLAQSKPVIAYVPQYDPIDYAAKIREYPLDYFKRRIMAFKADELFEDEKFEKIVIKKFPQFENVLNDFLEEYANYRAKQPFTLWQQEDLKFVKTSKHFGEMVQILSIAECFHFDKRAETLRKNHPLSMQVDIHSGIANGVLVVRNIKQCTSLIDAMLKNALKFEIKHEKEGYYSLIEEISQSNFRVITDYEKLKNSFWNFFKNK